MSRSRLHPTERPEQATLSRQSAGLLVYRVGDGNVVEVLLVHPGGPFWARKNEGSWSVPKGEYGEDEDARAAAAREFSEELGAAPPSAPSSAPPSAPPSAPSSAPDLELGEVRQAGGKRVRAWAVLGDLAVDSIHPNTFEIEWPKGSGRVQAFPEVDRAAWFPVVQARRMLLSGQLAFLDRLMELLRARTPDVSEG